MIIDKHFGVVEQILKRPEVAPISSPAIVCLREIKEALTQFIETCPSCKGEGNHIYPSKTKPEDIVQDCHSCESRGYIEK